MDIIYFGFFLDVSKMLLNVFVSSDFLRSESSAASQPSRHCRVTESGAKASLSEESGFPVLDLVFLFR